MRGRLRSPPGGGLGCTTVELSHTWPKDLEPFSLSLRSAAGRGQGERGLFLSDLKAPPLLQFAEEREKTLSHLSPIVLIQLPWGSGEGGRFFQLDINA